MVFGLYKNSPASPGFKVKRRNYFAVESAIAVADESITCRVAEESAPRATVVSNVAAGASTTAAFAGSDFGVGVPKKFNFASANIIT